MNIYISLLLGCVSLCNIARDIYICIQGYDMCVLPVTLHFQTKLKNFIPPFIFLTPDTRFFAIQVTKDSGRARYSQIIINRPSLSRATKLVYLGEHSISLWRISLINYRDKDRRVNENDLPFGACISIDRSSLDRSRASLTKKERRRTMENASRTWIVGGASGFVPDHRQLFDSVRLLQSRFNDRHRSRSFSATSHARNARNATFCRGEQRAVRPVTFTHSPTRAPRSSNFHPRCVDHFQEDSS